MHAQSTIDELRDELASARQEAASKAQAASGQAEQLFAQRSIADVNLLSKLEFLEKECTVLRDSSSLMQERLAAQTEQLFKTKESLTTRNRELESLLHQRTTELDNVRGQASTLEKEVADARTALETSRKTMREMQQEHSSQVSLLSQKASKYEELSANLEASLQEAQRVVESLRSRHDQYRDATSSRQAEESELLQTFQRDSAAKAKTIADLRNRVQRLENDLAVAGQARLQSGPGGGGGVGGGGGSGAPAGPSAMIQKLVEHTGSGTLSDWYERIVSAERELDESVKEKQHLHQLMNNILAAIEQQGPLWKAQSDDYKRALESQQDLADQIRDLDEQNERLREEAAGLRSVKARNEALEKTVSTLEESNRRLLWTAEGGGSVKPTADTMEQALVAAATAGTSTNLADAVRRHLPEYTSVSELSIKHSQLVKAFHEMSDRAAALEDNSTHGADIEADVLRIKTQLAAVVASRERSQQEIASLVQQRDALQIALANKDRSYLLQRQSSGGGAGAGAATSASDDSPQVGTDSSPARRSSSSSSSRAGRAAAAELETLRRSLATTRGAFEEYKKRRVTADDEQTKLLRAARTEANSKARDLSVAERDVEIYRERVEELKTTVSTLRAEARKQKEQQSQTFDRLMAQQSAVTKTTLARERDQVELANLRGEASKLTSHLELRKAECTRLQSRVDELEKRLRDQGVLLDKVQSIESAMASQKQAELERLAQDRDELRQRASHLATTAESLRADVQRLEASARNEAKERAAETARQEARLREAQQDTSKAVAELAAAREKYASLSAQHNALQAHIGAAKRRQSIRANAAASILASGDRLSASSSASAGGDGHVGGDGSTSSSSSSSSSSPPWRCRSLRSTSTCSRLTLLSWRLSKPSSSSIARRVSHRRTHSQSRCSCSMRVWA